MLKFDIYSYTNRGGKECNEDAVDERVDQEKECAFWAIADGLGGHYGGGEASRCVVHTLMDAWEQAEDHEEKIGTDWLKEQIVKANDVLLDLQKTRQGRMKSTVAALCVEQNRAVWAHVGDSRIYRLTEGEIFCLTVDHSVTYRKYRSGEIGKENINFDEDRCSLLRTVGDRDHCIPDSGNTGRGDRIHSGDGFLLCSDGFWEYLYEEEILTDFLKAENACKWGKLMMLRIMQRIKSDSDNLTFTVIRIQEEME